MSKYIKHGGDSGDGYQRVLAKNGVVEWHPRMRVAEVQAANSTSG